MFNQLFIRADGNPQIGTGHIMRCLSLADAFRERGKTSVLILAETYMQTLVEKRGYECLVLGSKYDRMEEELPILLPLLEEKQPSCVLLDSYFVTPEYMRAVRAKAPLVYLDDWNAFDYPADVVVNYNLCGEKMPYPPGKAYLLGPRYAPLRKQFQGLAPRKERKTVEQVLISTGGTDPCHVALGCAEYLLKHPPGPGTAYHFVLGAMNQDAGQIKKMASAAPYLVPHQGVSDMRGLMLQCDAAVSAAGTTLYELCACGLPAVTFVLADNQIEGAAAFEAAGLMPCAGDVRNTPHFAECIFAKLEELDSPELRRETARRMRALVDGNGAARLADRLGDLAGGEAYSHMRKYYGKGRPPDLENHSRRIDEKRS